MRRLILKKRNMVLAMALVLAMAFNVTAFAADTYVNELCNVSTSAPSNSEDELSFGGISTQGLGRPSTSNCVNLNNSALTFAGHAQGSTLYTNSHFTGKSTIGYSITNDCDSRLVVKFYTSSGWFKSKSITIEANATLTGTIDGLDADKMYYLTFSAPSDFSGSVY